LDVGSDWVIYSMVHIIMAIIVIYMIEKDVCR